MRITKQVQEQIFANIIADNHPLRQRADKHAEDVINMGLKLVAEVKAKDKLSDNKISSLTSQAEAVANYGKSFISCRAQFQKPYISDGYVFNTDFYIAVGGQKRTITVTGLLNARNGEINNEIPTPGARLKSAEKAMGVYLPVDRVMLPGDHWIADELSRLDAETDAINGEYLNLKSTVFAALSKCSTLKKLLEAWPEVEKYIPATVKPVSTALAISVADLNAMCGIPK